jgi:mRNA interferase MazF
MTDIVIDVSNPDFAVTGLCVSSTLQLHRLMTVTTSIIRRELGTLSQEMQIQVRSRLLTLFT